MKAPKMENEITKRIRLSKLIAGKRLGSLSYDEDKELDLLLKQNEHYRELYESFTGSCDTDEVDNSEKHQWEDFVKRYHLRPRPRNVFVKYAAILVLAVSVLGFAGVIINKYTVQDRIADNQIKVLPPPQQEKKSVLVLSNGERVIVENSADLLKATEKYNPDLNSAGTKKDTEPQIHTVIVPEYGKLSIVLNDGSAITINSGSTLKFPQHFTGDKREVWLNGEAIFNVKKDSQKRFVVHTQLCDVMVFGTNFNVNAYSEYSEMKTTLVSGSVKILRGDVLVDLKPGQEASSDANMTGVTVRDVDINENLSWLNDRFYFSEKPLDYIMLKLSRWYKVEIDFSNEALKNRKFTLEAKKYESINNILELLKETGIIKYTLSGNRIIISQ